MSLQSASSDPDLQDRPRPMYECEDEAETHVEEVSEFNILEDSQLASIHRDLRGCDMTFQSVDDFLVAFERRGVTRYTPMRNISYFDYKINLRNQVHLQVYAVMLVHCRPDAVARIIGQVSMKTKRTPYLLVDLMPNDHPVGLRIIHGNVVVDSRTEVLSVEHLNHIVDYTHHYQNLRFGAERKRRTPARSERAQEKQLEHEETEPTPEDLEIANMAPQPRQGSKGGSSFDKADFLNSKEFKERALDFVAGLSMQTIINEFLKREVDVVKKIKSHASKKTRPVDLRDEDIVTEPRRKQDDDFEELPTGTVVLTKGEFNRDFIYYGDVKQSEWRAPPVLSVPDEGEELTKALAVYQQRIPEMEENLGNLERAYHSAVQCLGLIDESADPVGYKRQHAMMKKALSAFSVASRELISKQMGVRNIVAKLSGQDVEQGAGTSKRHQCKFAVAIATDDVDDMFFVYSDDSEREEKIKYSLSYARPKKLFFGYAGLKKKCPVYYLCDVVVQPFGSCYLVTRHEPPKKKEEDFLPEKRILKNTFIGKLTFKCKLDHQRDFLFEGYKKPIEQFAREMSDEIKEHARFSNQGITDCMAQMEDVDLDKVVLPEWLFPDDCGCLKHCLCLMKCFSNGTVLNGLDRRETCRKMKMSIQLPSSYQELVHSLPVERLFREKDDLKWGDGAYRAFARNQDKSKC